MKLKATFRAKRKLQVKQSMAMLLNQICESSHYACTSNTAIQLAHHAVEMFVITTVFVSNFYQYQVRILVGGMRQDVPPSLLFFLGFCSNNLDVKALYYRQHSTHIKG